METKTVLLLAVMMTFIACSQVVSEEEAEQAALSFVSEHGRFFSTEESGRQDIYNYSFSDVNTVWEDGQFSVSFTVSSEIGNKTRSADVLVIVDKDGGVVNIGQR